MSNFLMLEGLSGESGNPRHIGEIDILSAVLGYQQPTRHSGKFPSSGKVLGDLSVTKKCDEDSHKLVDALVSGKIFASGKLTLEFEQNPVIINLNNVSIAAFSSNNAVETISLRCELPA